jgi:hypothetical protein
MRLQIADMRLEQLVVLAEDVRHDRWMALHPGEDQAWAGHLEDVVRADDHDG